MNIVKELRRKKGIQQKELSIEIGVSRATVSDWESGKKDPSGERLKKLANYFGVDELVILGVGTQPVSEESSGATETEQIVQQVLNRLDELGNTPMLSVPKTREARILAQGIDKLPQSQRKLALDVVKTVFRQYSSYFEKGTNDE